MRVLVKNTIGFEECAPSSRVVQNLIDRYRQPNRIKSDVPDACPQRARVDFIGKAHLASCVNAEAIQLVEQFRILTSTQLGNSGAGRWQR